MKWFTSDTHFCHQNILSYQQNRIFGSVYDMNEALISNWNSVVATEDECYVIGDFIMGHKKENIPFIVPRLNGKIFLVSGNHDGCFIGNKRSDVWKKEYEAYGITVLSHCSVVNVQGQEFLMCHFPYDKIDHADEPVVRFESYYPKDCGLKLLHGHIHSLRHTTANQFNVGVDVNNLFPVPEDMIINWSKA